MNLQRIFLAIASLTGMTGTFLPWASLPILGSIEGSKGFPGWFTFCMFAGILAAALAGNPSRPIGWIQRLLSAGLGIGALCMGLIKVWQINDLIRQTHHDNRYVGLIANHVVKIESGLYAVIVSGFVCLVVAALFGYTTSSRSLRETTIPDLFADSETGFE